MSRQCSKVRQIPNWSNDYAPPLKPDGEPLSVLDMLKPSIRFETIYNVLRDKNVYETSRERVGETIQSV